MCLSLPDLGRQNRDRRDRDKKGILLPGLAAIKMLLWDRRLIIEMELVCRRLRVVRTVKFF